MDTQDSTEKLQQKLSSQQHYTQYKIEPLDFISTNNLSFCQGNIIKYVCRYRKKNGLEDLIKARVYLDRLISEIEREQKEEKDIYLSTLIATIPNYKGCPI